MKKILGLFAAGLCFCLLPALSRADSGEGAVVLQDFSSAVTGIGGVFQDSQGSSFAYTLKNNPTKKGRKYLSVNYELKQGGYCGMWYRAGSDWDGVDLSKAAAIRVPVYSKSPVVLGLALKDKNNNQY